MMNDRGRDQFRQLQPGDVLTTLRSLPRRYRAELAAHPHLDLAAVAGRPGRDGRSLLSILNGAASGIAANAEAAYRAAILDASATLPPSPAPAPAPAIDGAVAALVGATDQAVEKLSRVKGDGWLRSAAANGRTTTVLELAQDAARAGVDGLRAMEGLLRELD